MGKRIAYISLFLMLCCLPMAAQLNGTGFYRVRNAQNTGNYISMANDKFSYQFLFGGSPDPCFGSAQQIGGGLSNMKNHTSEVKPLVLNGVKIFLKNDIHLIEDVDSIDPSTILYLKKNSGSLYNIISQGTSLLTLTTGSYKASVELIFKDVYATISLSTGSGTDALYTVSVNIEASDIENINYEPSWMFLLGKNTLLSQAKLGSYYFYDNDGVFSIEANASFQNAKWYIEPVSHINVKADVEFNGKYYTTMCVPFAYTLEDGVLNAYGITNIGDDGMLEAEVIASHGETVAAGTPVLLECNSNNASKCKLQLVLEAPAYTPAADKVQYAPAAVIPVNGGHSNCLRGTYFRNEDTPFAYQYNREGKSYGDTITLQNFTAPTNPQKYVIGITESGKLGFVKATGTAMPANKAWLEYTGTAELWLPFEKPMMLGDVDNSGDITFADVTAIVDIILGKAVEGDDHNYNFKAANVNEDEDGKITIADVTALLKILIGEAVEIVD